MRANLQKPDNSWWWEPIEKVKSELEKYTKAIFALDAFLCSRCTMQEKYGCEHSDRSQSQRPASELHSKNDYRATAQSLLNLSAVSGKFKLPETVIRQALSPIKLYESPGFDLSSDVYTLNGWSQVQLSSLVRERELVAQEVAAEKVAQSNEAARKKQAAKAALKAEREAAPRAVIIGGGSKRKAKSRMISTDAGVQTDLGLLQYRPDLTALPQAVDNSLQHGYASLALHRYQMPLPGDLILPCRWAPSPFWDRSSQRSRH